MKSMTLSLLPALWRRRLTAAVPVAVLLAACGGGSGGEAEAASNGVAATGSSAAAPTSTGPITPAGLSTDASRLPTGARGFSNERIMPSSEALGGPYEQGAFRVACDFSHMAFDDPIVFPGQPGRSHLHAFFGNTGVDANSTAESIANSGNSTCHGGTVNRTAYWVPAVIDTRTGVPVKPSESLFYYKPGYDGVNQAAIRPFPAGLRMIAGDPANRVEPTSGRVRFHCHNNSNMVGNTFPNCPAGDDLVLEVAFPQCWDGVNLDSPDHKSHMAYARNGCPASHPVPLPLATFNVHIPVTEAGQTANWRLSSDTYSGPPGYSMHGDWWNGWKPSVMDTWIRNCQNAGWDCHANLLGNGTTLF